MNFQQWPKWLLRLIKRPPQIAYALGLGPLMGRYVLLLTTIGRKTGRPRVTPLQYEEIDGVVYIGAANGLQSDWVRNLTKDPHVSVRVKNRRFAGLAETTTDVDRLTDFLQLRLKRHPRMVGAIMRADGLPPNPAREALAHYAAKLALVIIRPAGGAP